VDVHLNLHNIGVDREGCSVCLRMSSRMSAYVRRMSHNLSCRGCLMSWLATSFRSAYNRLLCFRLVLFILVEGPACYINDFQNCLTCSFQPCCLWRSQTVANSVETTRIIMLSPSCSTLFIL